MEGEATAVVAVVGWERSGRRSEEEEERINNNFVRERCALNNAFSRYYSCECNPIPPTTNGFHYQVESEGVEDRRRSQ